MSTARIDHVIFACGDLGSGAERVRRALGIDALPGGRHTGLGTENAIVPLGGAYVEVLAVADAEEAAGSELGRLVAGRIQAVGEGLVGWAVAVEDVEPLAARPGLTRSSVGRGGQVATLAGLPESLRAPGMPFFIERREPAPVPGTGAPGIDWLEVAADADQLDRWIGELELPVRVAGGDPGVRAVSVGGRALR